MSVRTSLAALAILAVALCATGCAGDAGQTPTDASAQTIRVPEDAATLAEAADRVSRGDVILISPGIYEEQLLIDTPDVTVRGVDRNATVIDGGGIRPYGVVAIADGVRVENITVTGATFYGVLFTGLHDESGPSAPTATGYERWDPADFPPLERFLVDHVTAYNNGLYGIYAFNARHGVIRDSYASGSADSGFYIGQCTECDILVTGNVAERNAVGFENANASDSLVIAANRFSENRIGMTLLSSYQEAFTPQQGNRVVGNLVSDNAEPDSPSQAEGAFATGVGISGGQSNLFERNRIAGHARAGLIFANTEDIPSTGNRLVGNAFESNAVDIANTSAPRSPATANCVEGLVSTLPVELATQLALCSADGLAEASVDAITEPQAPPGESFKRVAPPRDQPDLQRPVDDTPLPAVVTMPDTSTFSIPDADFLADRAGTR